MIDFFHTSNVPIKLGEILNPNYGSIILDKRYYSDSIKNHQQYLREMLFEEVRLDKYKDKPSRLKSIYLFDNLSLALQYCERLGKKYLYRVSVDESSNLLRADMNIIDRTTRKSIEELRQAANDYFNSFYTENPNQEILCEGTVRVENQINIGNSHIHF